MDQYSLYTIEKVVSTNAVKLKLPTIMRIHLVVSISQVVRYRKPVKRQKVEESKLVKVNREIEWKIEKNIKKIRGVIKYLVH